MIFTDTLPLRLVTLPSGDSAAVIYAVNISDVVLGLLLLTQVLLLVLMLWRTRRAR